VTALNKFADMLERRTPKETDAKREEKINQIIARMDHSSSGSLSAAPATPTPGHGPVPPRPYDRRDSAQSISSTASAADRRASAPLPGNGNTGPAESAAAMPAVSASQTYLGARTASSDALGANRSAATSDDKLPTLVAMKSDSQARLPPVENTSAPAPLPAARTNSTPSTVYSAAPSKEQQPSAADSQLHSKKFGMGSPLLMLKKSIRRHKSHVTHDKVEVCVAHGQRAIPLTKRRSVGNMEGVCHTDPGADGPRHGARGTNCTLRAGQD
jgi:hypothetical protein